MCCYCWSEYLFSTLTTGRWPIRSLYVLSLFSWYNDVLTVMHHISLDARCMFLSQFILFCFPDSFLLCLRFSLPSSTNDFGISSLCCWSSLTFCTSIARCLLLYVCISFTHSFSVSYSIRPIFHFKLVNKSIVVSVCLALWLVKCCAKTWELTRLSMSKFTINATSFYNACASELVHKCTCLILYPYFIHC